MMWVVRLDDEQLEVLRALVRTQQETGPALESALQALDLARWDELPDAMLPWDEIAEAAVRQGISEADALWDRSGRLREPAAARPGRDRRAKAARR
jgi:hypothetical protein